MESFLGGCGLGFPSNVVVEISTYECTRSSDSKLLTTEWTTYSDLQKLPASDIKLLDHAMPKVELLAATQDDEDGEVDLQWNPVKRGLKNYVIKKRASAEYVEEKQSSLDPFFLQFFS